MKVKRGAFIKQSVDSYVPNMSLHTGDVAGNETEEVFPLTNVYHKGRINTGGKKETSTWDKKW